MVGDKNEKPNQESEPKNGNPNSKEPKKITTKKYNPRQKSKIEKRQLQQRKMRFDRSMIHSDDVSMDQSILARLNSQYLDRFLRSNPHSTKILLSSDGPHQFIYKIVYKNGDGIKPQKGMGIKMRYKTYLMNGKKVEQEFGSWQRLYWIGRKRLPRVYDSLAMNVTEGEIGTMILSPKYTRKYKGKSSFFPPSSVVRVDYWILQVRKKDYWEIQDIEKCDEAELVLRQTANFIKELLNQPQLVSQKQSFIHEHLYHIRVIDDFLHYCFIPKSDVLKKKASAYQIYLLWFIGRKIQVLELMDKYFEIEGRNNEGIHLVGKEEELQKLLYKIKIEIEIELGKFQQVKQDIKDIRETKGYSEDFRNHFSGKIELWLKEMEEFDNLSEEEKRQKEEEYRRRKIELEKEERNSTQSYVYNPKGYRSNHPQNNVEPVELNCKVEYDDIIEWAIGEEKKYYEDKIQNGDQSEKKLYEYSSEENEDVSKRFDPKIHIQKRPNETQEEYEARRKEIELEGKFLQVKRVYGEDEEDYSKRREEKKKEHQMKEEKEDVKESALMRKLKKKMKGGFKNGEVPNMPREQAYKCFDIK